MLNWCCTMVLCISKLFDLFLSCLDFIIEKFLQEELAGAIFISFFHVENVCLVPLYLNSILAIYYILGSHFLSFRKLQRLVYYLLPLNVTVKLSESSQPLVFLPYLQVTLCVCVSNKYLLFFLKFSNLTRICLSGVSFSLICSVPLMSCFFIAGNFFLHCIL